MGTRHPALQQFNVKPWTETIRCLLFPVGGRKTVQRFSGSKAWRRRAMAAAGFSLLTATLATGQTVEIGGHFGAACSGNEFHCRGFGSPTIGTDLRIGVDGRWTLGGRFDHLFVKEARIDVCLASQGPCAETLSVTRSRSRQFVGAEAGVDIGPLDRTHLRLAVGPGLMRESVEDRCEDTRCASLPPDLVGGEGKSWRAGVSFGGDVLVPVHSRWSLLGGSRFLIAAQGTSFVAYAGAVLVVGSR